MKLKMSLLLAAAFLLRLWALDQSLWLDEATTAVTVRTHSFVTLFTEFLRFDFHPPLYYLFMKVWVLLFGNSEIVLRLPSVLFSLATGYVVYRIGTLLKNESAGLWAAAFFLFNPLVLYYSQEARMYMMVTFFLTAMFYFYIRTEKNVKKTLLRDVLLFNVFSFLSFCTFYGSIFPITAVLVYSSIKKRKLPVLFMGGLLAAVILLSPLLLMQLDNARTTVSVVLNWKQALGPASIKNLVLIPLKFFTGRISMEPKIVFFAVAGIWTAVISLFTLLGGFKSRTLLIIVFLTLVLGFLFSFFTPVLQYFRFIYLIPLIAVLIALSTGPAAKGMVLAGFIIWSCLYLFMPQFHRENWRELVRNLPGTPVYMILPSSDPLKYYVSLGEHARLPIIELRTLSTTKPTESITVIPYTADIYGYDYAAPLHQGGYRKAATYSVRGLQYEEWKSFAPPFMELNVEIL